MLNLLRSGRFLILMISGVVLILMVLGFNSRVSELRQLSAEATRMAGQQADLKRTQAVLTTKIVEAQSDDRIKRWAYEDAKMVQEGSGDHLVVPLTDEQAAPEATPTAEVEIQPVENWQVWMALLFGQDAP